MKALYRKYRPTKLSEVVGEEQVTKTLSEGLKKGKIAHAYLFIGPRGCGKTSVARIFAHEINGFKYELEDFYPDILEIDAASNTGVDNIRELRERAAVAPTEGKYKVYIIDEVHMLSKSAFNALLKTLEEPPAHVIFIMATTDAYKVPPTIVSRSQVFEFHLASPDVMKKHLGSIAKKEGIKIDDAALDLIVRRGGGSFRDSISILDQISTISSGDITAELITSSLGLPEQTRLDQLFEAYRSADLAEISARLKDLLNSGTRAEIIAEELISRIVDSPAPDLLPLLSRLSDVSAPFPEAKLLLAFTGAFAEGNSMPAASSDNKSFSPANQQQPPVRTTTRNYRRSEDGLGVVDLTTARRTVDEGAVGMELPKQETRPEEGLSSPARPPQSGTSQLAGPQETSSPLDTTPFDWQTYLGAVQSKSPSIADVLKKTTQEIAENILRLYPEKKIYKTILSSKNNAEILKQALPEGFALEILDPKDIVISTNDPHILQLSDIMGGKVMEVKTENGGDNPF